MFHRNTAVPISWLQFITRDDKFAGKLGAVYTALPHHIVCVLFLVPILPTLVRSITFINFKFFSLCMEAQQSTCDTREFRFESRDSCSTKRKRIKIIGSNGINIRCYRRLNDIILKCSTSALCSMQIHCGFVPEYIIRNPGRNRYFANTIFSAAVATAVGTRETQRLRYCLSTIIVITRRYLTGSLRRSNNF